MAKQKKISGGVINMNIMSLAPSAPWSWVKILKSGFYLYLREENYE